MELNLQPRLYHNIYLKPAIFFSIINTMENALQYKFMSAICQYIKVYIQGPLLYNDGYIKVFDTYTEPKQVERFIKLEKLEWKEVDNKASIIDILYTSRYCLFNIDEFYLPKSYYYKRVHYYRDLLLFGYENNTFMIMTNNMYGQYTKMIIDADELMVIIRKSLINASSNENCIYDNSWSVYLLSKKTEKSPAFNIQTFNELLLRNFDVSIVYHDNSAGIISEYDVYGFQIYNYIYKATQLLMQNIEKIDYRAYALLAERYKNIYETLSFLQDKYNTNCFSIYIDKYQQLQKYMKNVLYSMLKPCEFMEQRNQLKKACDVIQLCGKVDEENIGEIYKIMNNFI